jgi:hypothetical protein
MQYPPGQPLAFPFSSISVKHDPPRQSVSAVHGAPLIAPWVETDVSHRPVNASHTCPAPHDSALVGSQLAKHALNAGAVATTHRPSY